MYVKICSLKLFQSVKNNKNIAGSSVYKMTYLQIPRTYHILFQRRFGRVSSVHFHALMIFFYKTHDLIRFLLNGTKAQVLQ